MRTPRGGLGFSSGQSLLLLVEPVHGRFATLLSSDFLKLYDIYDNCVMCVLSGARLEIERASLDSDSVPPRTSPRSVPPRE